MSFPKGSLNVYSAKTSQNRKNPGQDKYIMKTLPFKQKNVYFFCFVSLSPCAGRESTGQLGRYLFVPCFPWEMGKHETAGTEQSNVPYFQTHSRDGKTRDSRDGTIQCPIFSDTQPGRDCPVFQRENTGQSGRDNVPYFQTDSLDGTLLSRIFNEKTRDGTISSSVF